MPFVKGKSGNPSGRPRVPDELKKSCRRLSMQGLRVLEEIINAKPVYDKDGKLVTMGAKDADRLTAIKLVMEYGYGKPVQPVGGEDEGGAVVVHVLSLADSSWDEDGSET